MRNLGSDRRLQRFYSVTPPDSPPSGLHHRRSQSSMADNTSRNSPFEPTSQPQSIRTYHVTLRPEDQDLYNRLMARVGSATQAGLAMGQAGMAMTQAGWTTGPGSLTMEQAGLTMEQAGLTFGQADLTFGQEMQDMGEMIRTICGNSNVHTAQ